MKPKKLRLFLSYASNDRELAAALKAALTKRGVDVYPDQGWPEDLAAALKKANGMVVFSTKAYRASPMASAEVGLALMMANLANKLIVLGDRSNLPWVLAKQPKLEIRTPPPRLAEQILEILTNQG